MSNYHNSVPNKDKFESNISSPRGSTKIAPKIGSRNAQNKDNSKSSQLSNKSSQLLNKSSVEREIKKR